MKTVYDIYYDTAPFREFEGAEGLCRFYVEARDAEDAVRIGTRIFEQKYAYLRAINIRAVARQQREFPQDYTDEELVEAMLAAYGDSLCADMNDTIGQGAVQKMQEARAHEDKCRNALKERGLEVPKNPYYNTGT